LPLDLSLASGDPSQNRKVLAPATPRNCSVLPRALGYKQTLCAQVKPPVLLTPLQSPPTTAEDSAFSLAKVSSRALYNNSGTLACSECMFKRPRAINRVPNVR
ncbi:unnamed protein product, partial [Ectocarpus sp. 12 AP-2014]